MVNSLPAVPWDGRCENCGRKSLTAYCDVCVPPLRLGLSVLAAEHQTSLDVASRPRWNGQPMFAITCMPDH
jgi:hypothetical protein